MGLALDQQLQRACVMSTHTTHCMLKHTTTQRYVFIEGQIVELRPLESNKQGFRLLLTEYCCAVGNSENVIVTIQPDGHVEQFLCSDSLECATLVPEVSTSRGEITLSDPRYFYKISEREGLMHFQPTDKNFAGYFLSYDGHQLCMTKCQ